MSHNVHPYSFRIGILRDWKSRWFRNRAYSEFLKADVVLREWLVVKLRGMYIADIEIERGQNEMNIILKTSRPGLLIGRGGEGIEKLRKEVSKKASKENLNLPKNFKISVQEVKSPEIQARIVAQTIADELERRMNFRRVLNMALEKVMASRDAKGIKVALSGRLDGAEMARYEWLKRGQVPLTTLRADIDFARERAHLPYGDIGIKVWIYKGEVFSGKQETK